MSDANDLMENELVLVTPEQKNLIRQNLGLTQEIIDRDVDTIVEWYNGQPHLPKHQIDRHWIERILVSNKWSLAKTKDKIDMTFATRGLMPELFTNMDPVYLFELSHELGQFTPLPKLNNNTSRVVILRGFDNLNLDKFNFELCAKFTFMIGQYRMHNDYFETDTFILDMFNANLGLLFKTYPISLMRAFVATKKVFGARTTKFHVINPIAHIDKFIAFAKKCISQKLHSRYLIHEHPEELYKYIDRAILPKDYGGYEKSCKELHEKWQKTLCREDMVKWFMDQERLKSDESQRPEKRVLDDMLGVDGSFRYINID